MAILHLVLLKFKQDVAAATRQRCYNDERDCREYQEEFENSLLKRCTHLKTLGVDVNPFNVSFRETSKKAGITTANGPENRLGTGHTMPRSGEWIEEFSGYTGFMAQINSHLEGKLKVKVAILDDGVNLDEIEEENQQGDSFSPTQEYWVGPCKHGTAMAKCVRQIYPSAELIIARLDDSRSNDNNDKAEFENLVNETLRNDKANLFGSHPDKGVNHEISRFAPVGLDNVIKICSATDYGAITQENLHTRPDLLLPGENVEGVWNGVPTVRGSSFATAYAAGFAALVLYTLQANKIFSEEDVEDDLEASKLALVIVKRHQGMRKVFRILAKKDAEDITARNCFVRPISELKVDDTFDVDLKKHLRKVVSQIVPQKVLKAKFS
ncbi:Cytochrome P450 family protein [Aspergillus niger]|uniref:Cytochrome P450 family protein n=1 Tax=Aspergillus niger TaxID=5061 RepID=A0A505ICH3_ASPNG|nr:Cytochrome P450 family protein [Aspergillus niger]